MPTSPISPHPARPGRATVIALSGGLDAAAGKTLAGPLGEAFDRGHDHVVLDFHEVRTVDQGGTGALAAAARFAARRGGTLTAVGLRPGLLRRVGPLVAEGLQLRGTVRAAVSTQLLDLGRRREPPIRKRNAVNADLPTTTPSRPRDPGEPAPRTPSLIITNAIVGLLRAQAGRGPMRAKTVIGSDTVVVTLRECLTTVERTLAGAGDHQHVMRGRHALHLALRDEATAVVEEVTGKRVIAYLADQHHDPDIAVIAFVLDPTGS